MTITVLYGVLGRPITVQVTVSAGHLHLYNVQVVGHTPAIRR